jgi:hypothetical protein
MYNLAYKLFFPLIFFNKFYVCIDFCYKLIFINKLIKYSWVNDSYCDVKYLGLIHLSIFLIFFLVIVNDFLCIYLHK